ncbi:hypothetical protein T492DRAFT_845904 [Pavlovales sp. CCMP2436]|nr:hypothetical protein T492DRAFT_845904 [Pavlovales sp. CCMP2436]
MLSLVQAKVAPLEAAPSKAELMGVSWEQLISHLRDSSACAGADVLAELTLGVVARQVRTEVCGDAAVTAGALPALVAAMCAHSATAAVQEQACRALINITAGIDAQDIERRQAAADAGALPLLVAAMGAHSANATVQEYACRAFCNITYGMNAWGDARKQTAVSAGGVLRQLVAAMGAHPATAAVQKRACWALLSITAGADAQSSSRRQAAAARKFNRRFFREPLLTNRSRSTDWARVPSQFQIRRKSVNLSIVISGIQGVGCRALLLTLQ